MQKKKHATDPPPRGDIGLYVQAPGSAVEVRLGNDTVWLTQSQLAEFFGVERSVITKHVRNIFISDELEKDAVCANFAHTADDGKTYKTLFYNLDAIISVGYRVNSKRATQFRVWATNILHNHLVRGYTVNEQRLLAEKNKMAELQAAIAFLQSKSQHDALQSQSGEILNLLSAYAKTLTVLEQYDKQTLVDVKGKRGAFQLTHDDCLRVIATIKQELTVKQEAGDLFGIARGEAFEGILGNLYQTFGGKQLYPTIEAKASHLLYFVIKDHPFSDGNKRIGSFLFVYYLDKSGHLYRSSGERKINDNALAALALLVAESDPKEKDVMVKIIRNLIAN